MAGDGKVGESRRGGKPETDRRLPDVAPTQRFGGALGDDPARVDHRHPVGQGLGLVHVVGGEDHRGAPTGHRPDEIPGAASSRGVEPGGGLVQHEQLRVPDDPEAEVEAPLLATRERLDPASALVSEPDELEHLVHGAGPRVVPGVAGQRLADRQEGLDGQLLEHDAQALAQLPTGRRIGGVVPEHLDPAAVARAEALEDLDRRGLAGTVGPEQGEDLALLHLEGDVA